MAIELVKLSPSVWALVDGSTQIAQISGGVIRIDASVKLGTDLISPSASELAALDGTLIASTGTESFHWWAIGT